jgi:hypothetical protein
MVEFAQERQNHARLPAGVRSAAPPEDVIALYDHDNASGDQVLYLGVGS